MAFFRAGSAALDDHGLASWKFEAFEPRRLPFNFIRCEMKALGQVVYGQGYAFFLRDAMSRALGEAWERAWLMRLGNVGSSDMPRIISSNGFAAGRTNEEAVAASRAELIERAVFLKAWSSMTGWRPHLPSSLAASLLSASLNARDWRIQFFLLETRHIGKVLACLARHGRIGAIFDATYVGEMSMLKVSEAKLLRSLTRTAELAGIRQRPSLATLPEIGSPDDHARYYLDPKKDVAFTFLDDIQTGAIEPLTLPDPQSIETRIVARAGQFPAVAHSYHPSWPELRWGQHSIAGANPWPHPLA